MEIGLILQKKNYLKKPLNLFIYLSTDVHGLGLSKDVLKIMAHGYANLLDDKVKDKRNCSPGAGKHRKNPEPKIELTYQVIQFSNSF